MLWKNELTEIEMRMQRQISGMNGTMWDQLSPMLEYLSSFSIPMFEEEVIKKDLIGMAKEAEIEQISLEEKLGMSSKEFCDNLIENETERTRKRKVEEQILELAVNFVWYLTVFLAHWGFAGCRTKNGLCIRYVIRIFRSIVRCMASWKTYYGMG